MIIMLKVILCALTIASLNGILYCNGEESERFFTDDVKYMPDTDHNKEIISETTKPGDTSLWTSVSNFFGNLFNTGSESEKSSKNRILNDTRSWSQMMKEEMQQISDSLSTMWSQTVNRKIKNLKTYLPNNETLQNLRKSYEQSAKAMKEIQQELQSLWRGSVTFVSLDNTTNTDNNRNSLLESLETQYNKVNNLMRSLWKELDIKSSINTTITEWSPTINGSRIESSILQLQQQFNDGWEQIANKVSGVLNSTQNDSQDSVEKMNRIQRDIQQLWNSITGNRQEFEDTQPDDGSVHKRIGDVWNNLKSYYNEKGGGSTFDGVIQSARDRVTRIGDYFRGIWQSGSDAIGDAERNIDTQRESISNMFTNLKDYMKGIGDRVNEGVDNVKTTIDNTKSIGETDQIEREDP